MSKKNITLKQLPKDEQPYERALSFGVNSLSDAELLAIILRTGTKSVTALELARIVLEASPVEKGLLGLHKQSIEELTAINGIGTVKAVQLKCIGELCRRMHSYTHEDRLILNSPSSIASYFMEDMRHLDRENLMLLMFDTKCRLIKTSLLSIGVVNFTVISTREVFSTALKYNAVFLILLHNHPSGDPTPSDEDYKATKKISDAGDLMGIPLKDHIIIGDNSYVSMHENGMF